MRFLKISIAIAVITSFPAWADSSKDSAPNGAESQLSCDLPVTDANANVVVARLKCIIVALQDEDVRTTQSATQYRAEALMTKAYLDQANSEISKLKDTLKKAQTETKNTQATLQGTQDSLKTTQDSLKKSQATAAQISKIEKELSFWRARACR